MMPLCNIFRCATISGSGLIVIVVHRLFVLCKEGWRAILHSTRGRTKNQCLMRQMVFHMFYVGIKKCLEIARLGLWSRPRSLWYISTTVTIVTVKLGLILGN